MSWRSLLAVLLAVGCAGTPQRPQLTSNTGVAAKSGIEAARNQDLPPDEDQVSAPMPASDETPGQMIEIDAIDDAHVIPVIAKLKEWDARGDATIYLKINSNGGSVMSGFDLSQTLENLHAHTVCIVDFRALSMGSFILQSCSERKMTPRAFLMFHEPGSQVSGTEHVMQQEIEVLRVIKESLVQQCVSRMKVSRKEFEAKINNHEWWMSYEEALKVGAVDSIIQVKDLPHTYQVKPLSFLELLFR